MSDDDGLLEGLPHTRPSVRTRRRAEAQAAADAVNPADPAPGSIAQAPDPAGDPSGFEQLARASVVAATGTAAVGLRLAGKAAGGLGRALRR